MKQVLISIFFQIAFAWSVTGQAGQYRVYAPDTEISKGLIKAVAPDSLGFIWFATDEGVVCFDGKQSIFYKNGLPGGYAKAFLSRKDGTLLVLHDLGLSEILSRPDKTEFREILGGSANMTDNLLRYPKTIYEDERGDIWVGEDDAVVWMSEDKIQKFYFGDNPGPGIIFRSFLFAEDEHKRLWCFSNNGELSYFDKEKEDFIKVQLLQNLRSVNGFVHLGKGKAWVGTEYGYYTLELSPSEKIPVEKLSNTGDISCAVLTDRNELFFGTWENGLYLIPSLEDLNKVLKIEELPFNSVWGMAPDEQNNGLWIAGKEQVALIRQNFFKTLLSEEPNYFKSLQYLGDDHFFAVNGDQLEIFRNAGDSLIQSFAFLVPHHAPTVGLKDDNKIWFGDLTGRLMTFDLNTGQIAETESVKPDNEPIEYIYKDRQNNIWAGGNSNYGLIRVAGSGSVRLYDKSQLSEINILFESEKGILYAAGGNEKNYLFRYDVLKDTFINISIPLPFISANNFMVEDIIELPNGKLWMATFDGILETDPESGDIRQVNLVKVPLNEPANSLVLSKDGSVWVSTTSGLIKYNDDNVLLFNKSSGLPANNISNRGLLIDDKNNIWAATPVGLATAQLSKIGNQRTPKPVFSKIKINGSQSFIEQVVQQNLPFKHTLELEFVAFSVPTDKVNYKTRIMPGDSAWSEASTSSRLLLSGLSAGDYEVQVVAQQEGGFLWSVPASFSFSVDSPWYQKLWGISLIIVGFLLISYGIARLYNLNLIRRNERLEKIIAQRTKEIERQKDEIIEQKENYLKLKEKQLNEEIEYKNKQLTTYTLHFIQKNEALKELRTKIFLALRNPEKNTDNKALKSFLEVIDDNFRNDEEWKKFQLYFEQVHTDFFEKLKGENSALTSMDLRHCSLIRLNLSIKEIATIMGISVESVKTSRFRLRKKMNIESQQELNEYILTI